MNRRTIPRGFTTILLLAVAASQSSASQGDPTVRDSAGVAVVEYGPDLPRGIDHWRLEPAPVMNIGKAEGEDVFLFSRVVAANALPGERVLVADRAASEIRIFDAEGRFVHRMGRNGSGPGEFRDLAWVGVRPIGEIVAYDGTLRRFSRFSDTGTLQEMVSLLSPVPRRRHAFDLGGLQPEGDDRRNSGALPRGPYGDRSGSRPRCVAW